MPDSQSLLPRTSLLSHSSGLTFMQTEQGSVRSSEKLPIPSRTRLSSGGQNQERSRGRAGRTGMGCLYRRTRPGTRRGLSHQADQTQTRPIRSQNVIVCSKNFLQGPTLEFSEQPLPSGNWRGRRVRTTSLLGEQTVRWARRSWEGAWRHTCCATCSGPGAKGAPSITVQRLPLQAPPTSFPAPSSGFRDCLGRI